LRSKRIWLLVSAGVALGVLVWSAERQGMRAAAPAGRTVPAPSLRALDQPASASAMGLVRLSFGGRPGMGVIVAVMCKPGPCKADDTAKAEALEAQREAAIRPARGTSPRAVAALRNTAFLLAWRNHASEPCFFVARGRVTGDTLSGSSVFGPCVHDRVQPCTAICLSSGGTGPTRRSITYLLAGTVSGAATALRVTTRRATTTYLLRGPLWRDTGRRLFMLDLGRNDYRMLELMRGHDVIDSRTLPAFEASVEDCTAAHPVMTDFKSCIQKIPPSVPSATFP
jgi:hypothetical protein